MSLAVNQAFIGWSMVVSGIIFVLGFFFLAPMFTFRTSLWGPLNDVTYVLALIFIIPFLFGIYGDAQSRLPFHMLSALLFGFFGIGLIAYTQIALVLGRIEFSLNLRQGAVGAGLLGLTFVINHLVGADLKIIPIGLNWLGLAAGLLMSMGLPTGFFYGDVELKMTTGQLGWKNTNLLATGVVILAFLGQIALIIYVFSTGIFHI